MDFIIHQAVAAISGRPFRSVERHTRIAIAAAKMTGAIDGRRRHYRRVRMIA
jgi:hypothetical protein